MNSPQIWGLLKFQEAGANLGSAGNQSINPLKIEGIKKPRAHEWAQGIWDRYIETEEHLGWRHILFISMRLAMTEWFNIHQIILFLPVSICQPKQYNFELFRNMRRHLKADFGLHITEEFHTRQFLTDKNPYRNYGWTHEEKQEILKRYTIAIASLDMKCINVIIDKTRAKQDTYPVLENALTYSIQRIENDSNGQWKYIILSDKGRVGIMNHAARKIRAFNPIPSMFGEEYRNQPIKNMVEDILEKDSKDSYFIQICDFISYFAHLYFVIHNREKSLPNRVQNVIDNQFVGSVFATLKKGETINLKASRYPHPFGFVIYPK